MNKKRLKHIEKLRETIATLEYLINKSRYKKITEEEHDEYKRLIELEKKLYSMIKFESISELRKYIK